MWCDTVDGPGMLGLIDAANVSMQVASILTACASDLAILKKLSKQELNRDVLGHIPT